MIVNSQRSIPIAVKPLTEFFERVRRRLGFPEHGVTVRFLSDPAMARLNQDFRGKQGTTDVLSFPARSGRSKRPSAEYVGDIAISPQTAGRNARLLNRRLPAEIRILILHGMIHLAGYDHETDHGEMCRFEGRLRRELGLEGEMSVGVPIPANIRPRVKISARGSAAAKLGCRPNKRKLSRSTRIAKR